MLDTIEAALLAALPFSFSAKTLALALMWYDLRFRTVTTTDLGRRINTEYRDQAIMSALLTWLMVVLFLVIDSGEIHWPVTSPLLFGLAVWPFRTAWAHFRVFRGYRELRRRKADIASTSGPTV